MRVLFWVTHLLGTGHVHRAAAIVRALRRRKVDVIVTSGGFPVPGVDWDGAEVVQLKPVRSADASYRRLLGEDGAPVDAGYLAIRREQLLQAAGKRAPRAIVTELFPLGRRALRGELDALLNTEPADGARPAVFASVRDILEPPSSSERVERAADRLRRHYQWVLVHGDPRYARLEDSYPLPPDVRQLVRYTGYVTRQPTGADAAARGADGVDEVVVSAGGGAVGEALYRAALGAAARDSAGRHWRILVGHGASASLLAELSATAGTNVTVEPARSDFPMLLTRAAVSVSQAGYNTVCDILGAGCRAVLVPFAQHGEQEQSMRAGGLAAAGRAVVLPERELDATRLVAAVGAALAGRAPVPGGADLNGAEQAADTIRTAIETGPGDCP